MELADVGRMTPGSGKSRTTISPWSWLVLGVAAALYLGNVVRYHQRFWDDSFITFRFSRNLAEGLGLVWNAGGERSEGYTGFLHVLILAATQLLGIQPDSMIIPLGVACSLGSVALMGWTVHRATGTLSALASLPLALFLADDATAVHSTSGLETPLFFLLLTGGAAAALELLARPTWKAACALGILSLSSLLCRPEGALVSCVLFAVIIGRGLDDRVPEARRAAWLALGAGAGVTVAVGCYVAWKYAYFGYLLPNPYYVKSDQFAFRGVTEVKRYVKHEFYRLGLAAAVVLVMAVVRFRRGELRLRVAPLVLLLAPVAIGLGFYATILHEIGGAHRFSFPLTVYVTLALALAATWVSGALVDSAPRMHATRRGELAAALAGAALVVAQQPTFDFSPLSPSEFNGYHLRIGTALKKTGLNHSATVLADAAGVIPYVSRLTHVDRVGLTDNTLSGRSPLTLAEREAYMWGRKPDVYVGCDPPASPSSTTHTADPRMASSYVAEILLKRPLVLVETRIFLQDPVLLHARMRHLRDEWEWVGEVDWPGWRLWQLKSFLYVRKGSHPRLREELERIIVRQPHQVSLNDVALP